MPSRPFPAAAELLLAALLLASSSAFAQSAERSPVPLPTVPLAPKVSATAPDMPAAPAAVVPPPTGATVAGRPVPGTPSGLAGADPKVVAAAMAAANAKPGPRTVPGRTIPVPTTVSPELRVRVAAPYPKVPDAGATRTPQGWNALIAAGAAKDAAPLPALRNRLGVTSRPATMAGVPVFVIEAKTIPPAHSDQVILAIHGGGFVFDPGEAGTLEAVLMAGLGRYKVIAVDYRMPPDHPYPAGLDDVLAVYKDLLKRTEPGRVGVVGTSAGGGLTLSLCLRAKREGVQLPGAIAPGTPEADLTVRGDTFATNAWLDNVLVSPSGLAGLTKLYVPAGHDLKDPLLSPVYGDFHGMPPAILTSGTRDLFLSNTVRVHRKLREAGVDAVLQVFEAMSHAQYLGDGSVPETREAFAEITRFFDGHLARSTR